MGHIVKEMWSGVSDTQRKAEAEWLESHKKYVYFIQSDAKGKPVKVGWSHDPEARITTLSGKVDQSWRDAGTLSILFVIPVAYPQQTTLENEIHDLLFWSRVDRNTEWFLGPDFDRLRLIKRDKYIADWSELDFFLQDQAA